jgi:alpha-mannosidase
VELISSLFLSGPVLILFPNLICREMLNMDIRYSLEIGNLARKNQDQLNSTLERIQAQLSFAQALIDLNPDRKSQWQPLLASASNAAASAENPAEILEKVEKILAPLAQLAKSYTISYVGHAHIDMNWMWSWPETVALTRDTFITVLKLMDEFPGFCFSQSQASTYAIIQKYAPELFEKIKARVRDGRWEVAACQWVEGDKNLASGESLAHHLLYTRRYFQENFNLSPEDVQVGWEPDTFGHAATIPSILAAGGVKYYYMCRGGVSEKPPVFYWQGPDGSRLLVNLELSWYINHIGPHNTLPMAEFCKKTGLKHWMCVFGVGDHGGGPTRRDLSRLLEMQTWPIFPALQFSTAASYFKFLESQYKNIPVLTGELNYEFTGCYSSQSQVKKMNRRGEYELQRTQGSALLASRGVNRPYPADSIRDAWVNILFGQFHDILPGSLVKVSREYQSGLFQQSHALANSIQTDSLRQIAEQIDTTFAKSVPAPVSGSLRAFGAGPGRNIFAGRLTETDHAGSGAGVFAVFNPTAWQRNEIVKLTLWDVLNESDPAKLADLNFAVRQSDGTLIAAQQVASGDYWGHTFVDIVFPAAIPAFGYAVFAVELSEKMDCRTDLRMHSQLSGVRAREIGPLAISNDHIEVLFNSTTGAVEKFIDKKSGIDLARPGQPFAALEYVLERPGPMSAWTIHEPNRRLCPLDILSVEPIQRGPHSAVIAVKSRYNDSTFTVEYTLQAGLPWMEIYVKVNWLERGGPEIGTPKLRLQFPVNLDDGSIECEIPYGSITRKPETGQELPSQKWVAVAGLSAATNRPAQLVLLNDSTYGYSFDNGVLAATLIRSSYEPDPLPEMGDHEMRFAVMPSGRQVDRAEIMRAAAAFNMPLQIVSTGIHKGKFAPLSKPGIVCEPAGVVIAAAKQAEDEDAMILRLLETSGQKTRASIRIDDNLFGQVASAALVDLLERPIRDSGIALHENMLTLELQGNSVSTVKIALARPV